MFMIKGFVKEVALGSTYKDKSFVAFITEQNGDRNLVKCVINGQKIEGLEVF